MHEAQRLAAASRVNEAMEALAKAKQSAPRLPAPYLMRAQLFAESARYREAWEEARAAHKIAPNDPAITLALLRYTPPYLPAAETERLARQAVAQAPQSGEAHYYLGLALVNSGDPKRYPEALEAFQEASRLAPMLALPLIEMGKLHRLLKDDAQAETMLLRARRALELQRQSMEMPLPMVEEWVKQQRAVAFWLAQVYRRMGQAVESRAAAAEADRWSARAAELRALRDRAAASPTDPQTRARLEELLRRKP